VTKFGIGSVLGTSVRLFMNNIVPFMALAFMLYVPALQLRHQMPLENRSLWLFGLGLLLDSVLAAIVTYGVLKDLQGTRPSFKDCIVTGLRQAPFVLGVAVLSFIAIVIGMVLLVIPGLIVATMVYVAVPVALVERPGMMESLRRSRDLVDGHKGSLFVILLLTWGMKAALSRWFAAMFPGDMQVYATITTESICGVFVAISTAVAYTQLRAEREGITVPDLATAIIAKSHGKAG
jgi:hypothetical protein